MGNIGERLFSDMSMPALVAAAHELKAPLALIRQLALSLEEGNSDPHATARLANRITLSSERALRLTTDLTRASRLQAELFELGPVNPIELCEDIAEELRPLFAARGMDIRVRRNRQNILAVANRDLLRRILANFSDNALEYAGMENTVELAASARGSSVRIGVRDYGPAMSKQQIKKLKSNLGTGAQAVHSRPGSSGLGLYLASQFADYMDSSIGTINHRDGMTFYVDLPASKQMSLL